MATTGTVNYHLHKSERQAYQIDANGVSGRLASPEQTPTEILLNDVRDDRVNVSFAQDGMVFVNAPTNLHFADGWEAAYEEQVKRILIRELGVHEVRVFDHTLRIDDANASRRPARNVHTDYSPEGARARLDMLLGEEEGAIWNAGHFAFVNIWRPVSLVIQSAPLGFVRPKTVQPSDWVTLDLVYPERTGQIMGLVSNPKHEWLYLSKMTSDEVVIFNIHDNQGLAPVAHSAVDLRGPKPSNPVRKSLETRTLVRY